MAGKKGKKKNKQDKKKEAKPLFSLSPETKNSIWGVLSFAVATISVLAFIGRAGIAGEIFSNATQILFGWGLFLIPLSLVMLGATFFRSLSSDVHSGAVWGTILFVLSFLAIFYILGEGAFQDRIDQGGYLGVALGYPLLHFFGFTAAFIVLIFLLLVSILISLDIPVHNFFMREEKDSEGSKEAIGMPVKEAIVIKRGAQIMKDGDDKKPLAKLTNAEMEEKEFKIKPSSTSGKWVLPPATLLSADDQHPKSGDISANVNIIKRTLANFGIDVEMGEVSVGPTVTQYTLRPAVGVKLNRITALQNDLALALAAHPIRVEAPIPGKSLVGIEVPNAQSAIVGMRDLIDSKEFIKSPFFLPLAMGRDVAGYPVYAGLEKMPHLLIAGTTGSGKSVSINTIILSLLYRYSPDLLKFIMIDPKRVELSLYNNIPHLITPVIVDNKKAASALKWVVREMERRYQVLSEKGVRDIFSYNEVLKKEVPPMPFIVVIIDELADLMASFGKDVEGSIVRLAQMSRAVGIHLIVSTQRPSVEVITGLIKANITSRVAFQVPSLVDSRTILDASGAERLLGRGDMLLQSNDSSKPRRVQGALVSEKEIKKITEFIKDQADGLVGEEIGEENNLSVDLDQAVQSADQTDGDVDDDLYEQAQAAVIQAQKASASMLQRRLRVGYARAARLIDIMEDKGIVGPQDGAKPREVYVARDGDDGSTASVIDEESGEI